MPLSSGNYEISVQSKDKTYSIGFSPDGPYSLCISLQEDDPSTFRLQRVNETDEYVIFVGEQAVNEKDGKLCLGNNTNKTWKIVPVDDKSYRIKGSYEGAHCWTLALPALGDDPNVPITTLEFDGASMSVAGSTIVLQCNGVPPPCLKFTITAV